MSDVSGLVGLLAFFGLIGGWAVLYDSVRTRHGNVDGVIRLFPVFLAVGFGIAFRMCGR